MGTVSHRRRRPAFSEALGGRREWFRCVLESCKQKFTLFSSEGVPLRATLTVSLREYRTLEEQLQRLHLSSPERTHGHVTERGDCLASVSHRYYETPAEWRAHRRPERDRGPAAVPRRRSWKCRASRERHA